MRICLIIAIIASLAAIGIGGVKVRQNVLDLQKNYADMTADRDTEKSEHAKEKARAEKAEKSYANEKTAHQATRTQLAETKSNLAEAQKNNEKLSADLEQVKGERTAAQQELEVWKLLDVSPDQVTAMKGQIKQDKEAIAAVEAEKVIIKRKLDTAVAQLKHLLDESSETVDIPMTPGLKGNVTAVDPKWDFIVLDVGTDQGAANGGVMLISHDSKLVAKVRIYTTTANACIANVLPGWQLGEIAEGDKAIY